MAVSTRGLHSRRCAESIVRLDNGSSYITRVQDLGPSYRALWRPSGSQSRHLPLPRQRVLALMFHLSPPLWRAATDKLGHSEGIGFAAVRIRVIGLSRPEAYFERSPTSTPSDLDPTRVGRIECNLQGRRDL